MNRPVGEASERFWCEIPHLVRQLGEDDASSRNRAAVRLGTLGPDAAEAVPALVAALEDRGTCLEAAHALGQIGPAAEAAAPGLARALEDPDEWVRMQAAGALGNIGPAAKDAVPQLVRLLQDKSPYVRVHAAGAIWEISQQTEVVTAVLREASRAGDSTMRKYADKVLKAINDESGARKTDH